MENCLVTKLNAVVENDNLPIFGGLKITVGSTAPFNLRLNTIEGKELGFKIDENHIIESGTTSCVKIDDHTGKVEYDSTTGLFTFSGTGSVTAIIENYYYLTQLRGKISTLDLSYLKYMNQLLRIECASAIGDTSVFRYCPNITNISLAAGSTGNNNNITGSILDFGTNIYLAKLEILRPRNYTKKSLEEFVSLQRAAGRTTESGISVMFNKSLDDAFVTFNGEDVSSGEDKTLSWTADTITYDGVTISA